MLKGARKWAADQWGEGVRSTIVTLAGSFHGRTMATLAATGQDSFHHHFGPFPAGFRYARPNDPDDLQSKLDDTCCAVLLELVQGEGGVRVLKKSYVQAVAALCKQKNLLLLVDEVQTGNGRTGTLYAFEQFGITPDIFSTAKGLAGGLPLGATLFGAQTAQALGPGDHGSTFGGNPVCAAAALHVLNRLDPALLEAVRAKGDWMRRQLAGCPGVGEITGLGLMLGILPTHRPAKKILADCLAHGVAVLTAKDKVRLLPPLTTPMDVLQRALPVLQAAFAAK
jgi:acetylornithine/N-succinyldiaminopimelate aminotransferase